ncbi:hypothetical protein [Agromyces subbeticus]|uniref:hypothetical protein n=1 Tax=Agromyces subbeticus TaxID=293890 RepID=UPI0003B31ACA|nr:hypothetical protein [Agromyces subbeticus]
MGDALTVSGGGSTAVAVDELFAEAVRLATVEHVVADLSARAGVITRGLAELDLARGSAWGVQPDPCRQLDEAIRRLAAAHAEAGLLRQSLLESAERYGFTEHMVGALWGMAGRVGAWLLGWSAPLIVGAALPAIGIWAATGSGGALEDWLAEHPELLSDPAFVRLVRTAADSADEFAAGLLHLPSSLTQAGVGIGAPENASMLLAAAGLVGAVAGSRVLVDAPVRVTRALPDGQRVARGDRPTELRSVSAPVSASVPAPTGIADLVARIPATDDDAQIRVERYGGADDPRWVVYIGGTVDLGLTAGAQPNDMTNNLHGIADDSPLDALRVVGEDSGAGDRAVRLALAEAGVQPGDPIFPIGHSGGGVNAAGLAGDPELNVVGAVSVGGPVASAPLRDGVPLLSLEHEEDLVPATGGAGHPSPDRLTVSRSVLEPGVDYETALPAHELSRYRQTGALIDASEEQRLVEFREQLATFTGCGTGEMSRWIGTRDVSSSTTDEPRGR